MKWGTLLSRIDIKKIFNRFSASRCLLCLEKISRLGICSNCKKDFPFIKTACPTCGTPISHESSLCGHCLKTTPPFNQTYALFSYEPPIAQFILQLKLNHQLCYAQLFGEWMADFLKDKPKPQMIIPVPLHPQRIRERGYNQSLEIARPIAKNLRIPIELWACRRVRPTKAQAELPETERKSNVKNAFIVETSFQANHVAILDDVVTTGNTVSELARLLKKQSIKRVDIWCIAKAIK
jgi:ComF family protein